MKFCLRILYPRSRILTLGELRALSQGMVIHQTLVLLNDKALQASYPLHGYIPLSGFHVTFLSQVTCPTLFPDDPWSSPFPSHEAKMQLDCWKKFLEPREPSRMRTGPSSGSWLLRPLATFRASHHRLRFLLNRLQLSLQASGTLGLYSLMSLLFPV